MPEICQHCAYWRPAGSDNHRGDCLSPNSSEQSHSGTGSRWTYSNESCHDWNAKEATDASM